MIKLKCQKCNKEMFTTPSKNRKFCSLKCRTDASRSKIEDCIYYCKFCGKKKVAIYPSVKKTFCSPKCAIMWKWENIFERGCYINCYSCGKPRWVRLGELKKVSEKYYGVFCSNKCFHNFTKGKEIPWLKEVCIGRKPWNTGLQMSDNFKEKCKNRAINQWKGLEFRKKQMSRDFSKFSKGGIEALKEWHKNNKIKDRYKVRKSFLKKLGVTK